MGQQAALDAIRQPSKATPVAEVRDPRFPISDSTPCQCIDEQE